MNMHKIRYKITFSGEIIPGYTTQQVKKDLSKLFNIPLEKCERFFTGQTITVKNDVDIQTVRNYQDAFHKIGAICHITPPLETPSEEPPSFSLATSHADMFPEKQPAIPIEATPIGSVSSTPSFSDTRLLEIIKPVPFPQALLKFRSYDGAKTFAAFMFVLGCIYFSSGLFNLFSWQNKWWRPDFPMKFSYFLYHIFIFTIVYCFAWIVFDRRGIEGYALSIFSILVGVIYVLSPLDFIPDMIPTIGLVDDISIGLGGILLGIRSWMNSRKKSLVTNEISILLETNRYQEAIERFLIQEGYKIKK